MDRVWFVFVGDHHLGPFTAVDLESLFTQNKIGPQTLVWREGEEDWRSLHEVWQSYRDQVQRVAPSVPLENEDELDFLPPIPQDDEWQDNSLRHSLNQVSEQLGHAIDNRRQQEQEVEEGLPPLPIEQSPALGPEHFEEDLSQEMNQSFAESEYDELVPEIQAEMVEEMAGQKLVGKTLFGIISLLTLLTTLYFLFGRDEGIQNFKNVRVKDYQLLRQVAVSKHDGLSMHFALTRNADFIWSAANLPGNYRLYIQFKSRAGQILSERGVTFSSEGDYFSHGAVLREFKFLEGEKIVPGRYDIEVRLVAVGIKVKLAKWFKKKGYSFFASLFDVQLAPVVYSSEILLYGKEGEEFDQVLAQAQRQRRENILLPLQDTLQQYQTYQGLITKLNGLYFEILKTIWRGKDIKKFEQRYAVEIGPMLQNLILTATEQQKKASANRGADRTYGELVDFGKKVGEMAADMVTFTEDKGWLKKEQRTRLEKIFNKRIATLQEEVSAKIKVQMDELKKIQ